MFHCSVCFSGDCKLIDGFEQPRCVCHHGFVGEDCSLCETNFAGDNCDRCKTNYIGYNTTCSTFCVNGHPTEIGKGGDPESVCVL